jgi:hypothetical protein
MPATITAIIGFAVRLRTWLSCVRGTGVVPALLTHRRAQVGDGFEVIQNIAYS